MAKAATEDELDLGIEKQPASKKKLFIVIGAVVLFLLIGTGVAAFFLVPGDEEQVAENTEETAAAVEETKAEAIYHALDPKFVVNLEGRPRMLQVGIQLLIRDSDLKEFLSHNDPMIRHSILSILSIQDGKKLKSREGKEGLQSELLKEVQKIVDDQGGTAQIEALFFTSFVMQ